jgi:hypothetical protein
MMRAAVLDGIPKNVEFPAAPALANFRCKHGTIGEANAAGEPNGLALHGGRGDRLHYIPNAAHGFSGPSGIAGVWIKDPKVDQNFRANRVIGHFLQNATLQFDHAIDQRKRIGKAVHQVSGFLGQSVRRQIPATRSGLQRPRQWWEMRAECAVLKLFRQLAAVLSGAYKSSTARRVEWPGQFRSGVPKRLRSKNI